MSISEKTIAAVKAQLRIDDVISDFVPLKRKGSTQNSWACCPFPGHNEQTPSFAVQPEKGFYKCFGCGEAGDTIDFLQKIQGLSYPEAIEHLAKKYHIPITLAKKNNQKDSEQRYKEGLYLLMRIAQQYYTEQLKTSQRANNYLAQRGITHELQQRFHIGCSPDSPQSFYHYASQKGYNRQQLLDAGLIKEKDNIPYDLFRHRLLFPIVDRLGRVVGFGGRTLRPNDTIKYINSPETIIYQKSHHLYGFYQAKNALRKQDACYIVEGYTDVIALHHIGIQHVVAASGTTITPPQITLIKRCTPNVVLLLDSDDAGQQATSRGIDRLLQHNMNVKVVPLPQGEDPASFIAHQPREDAIHYLDTHQQDFITFRLQALQNDDPQHKTTLINNILQSIAYMPDPIKRAVYIDLCSRLTGINKNTLTQTLRRQPSPRTTSPPKQPTNLQYQHPEEAALIKQLLHHGNTILRDNLALAGFVFNELQDVTFTAPAYKTIYDKLHAQYQADAALSHETLLAQTTEQDIKNIVIDLLATPLYLTTPTFLAEMSANWRKYDVLPQSTPNIARLIEKNISYLKRYRIQQLLDEEQQRLDVLDKGKDAHEAILTFEVLKDMQRTIDHHLGIAIAS